MYSANIIILSPQTTNDSNVFSCILIGGMRLLKERHKRANQPFVGKDERLDMVKNTYQNTPVCDSVPIPCCVDVLQTTLDIMKHHRAN